LRDTTRATLKPHVLGLALDSASENASDRVFAAAGRSFGRTNVARRHLRRATTLLARHVALLAGSAAQAIPPDARKAMMTEALSIQAQEFALRTSLACPNA
jgi:hypothetical protein